ncbi:MAG: filamentous hemagglutinin N-terminal domain-containing protein [Synechococcales bacterium]|nr:filamentous hemagglutinin N-terminal domain-containing protein [Synechococcales bacterium]
MNQDRKRRGEGFRWHWVVAVGIGACLGWSITGIAFGRSPIALAQTLADRRVVPDGTLGAEGSLIREIHGDRLHIEGGAVRGRNLFHSFREFGIELGGSVYFTNPAGIENILSRVTGRSPSDIQGTLGVLGNANLFLLNPNGIIFGPNARLDIRGSFVASTSDRFAFADGSEFSAIDPQAPPLLTVAVPIGLQPGEAAGDIASEANLATGADLSLAGQRLDLEGGLQAGGSLTLLGETGVELGDRPDRPLIVTAQEGLLIQGNDQVLIQALSHPASGLTAGGDLVLRSGQPITTDARFWSGGSFRIEGLAGTAGDFQSPNDPVIRALGDVVFDAYEGASLHIFAGGRVEANQIVITGPDTTGTAIAEPNIRLSDGETTVNVDGTAQPTLDVRAGMAPAAIGTPSVIGTPNPLNPADPLPTVPSHSLIRIGEIAINAPDGLVFLTNQYQPNLALPAGNVRVDILETGTQRQGTPIFAGNGGAVVVDARGNIRVGDRLDASSDTGRAGDVSLLADGEVRLNASRITTNNLGSGRGGDVTIRAAALVGENGAQIESSTFGQGDAGRIAIFTGGDVTFSGERTGIVNIIRAGAVGNGGGIAITAGEDIILTDGAQLQARVGDRQENNNPPLPSFGTSGNITLVAGDRVVFQNAIPTNSTAAITSIERQGQGTAGNIFIQARQVEFRNGGQLQSNTLGTGPAGNITIRATDRVLLSGRRNGRDSEIFTRVNEMGVGDAGNIDIEVTNGTVDLAGQARLISRAFGMGSGGDITVTAQGDITITDRSRVITSLSDIGVGTAGNIYIESRNGTLEIDGENRNFSVDILTETSGSGNGGSITLVGGDRVFLHRNVAIRSDLNTAATDVEDLRAGDIQIRAGTIEMTDRVAIAARTSGWGDGGNIRLEATGPISLENRVDVRAEVADGGVGDAGNISLSAGDGIRLFERVELAATVAVGGTGNAGDITIAALGGDVTIDGNDRANPPTRVLTETEGAGSAGNITITAADTIRLQNEARVRSDRRANGQDDLQPFNAGNILLEAGRIEGRNIVEIESRTNDLGSGGTITLRGRDGITFSDLVEIRSEVLRNGVGNAGDITLEALAGSITVFDDVAIAASVRGQGNSGQMRLTAQGTILLEQDVLIRSSLEGGGVGQAGNIDVTANTLSLRNGAQLAVRTEGRGDAGGIIIRVADSVILDGAGDVPELTGIFSSVEPGAFGNGGEILVEGRSLSVSNGARLDASTRSLGNAGNVIVRTTDAVTVATDGIIFSGVDDGATGNGGAIEVTTHRLTLETGGRIETRTLGYIPSILAAQQVGVDYGESVLGDRPVAYWPLDEAPGATVAGDRSGQGFDGTYEGTVTPGQPGVSGTAAEFSQAGSAVTIGEIPPDSPMDVREADFTVEAWIHPNGDAPEEQVYFALHDRDRFLRSLNLSVRDDGSLGVSFRNDDLETPAGTIPFDQWTHVVVRYDRTADLSTVYINGVPVANGAQGPFQGQEPTARIGSWRDPNDQPFNGRIDEVVFYDELLSPQSIAERFFIGRANLGLPVPNLATSGANAGNLTIRAQTVDISGVSATLDQSSGLFSGTEGVASGRGGTLNLTTGSLRVADRGVVSAVTQNQSQGGSVEITADTLSLESGGQILTTAFSQGDAGGVILTVGDRLTLSGQSTAPTADNDGTTSGIFGRTLSTGNAGTLAINTGQLSLTDGAEISVSTAGMGRGGAVRVTAADTITLTRSQIAASTSNAGSGGDVSLAANRIVLQDSAQITASTTAMGRGGAIALNATDAIDLNQSQIAASTTGSGQGGDIDLRANQIRATNESQMTASTTGSGSGGTIGLQGDDSVDLFQAEISASTTGTGRGGDIEISGDRLSIQNQSQITASTSGPGDGGTISLQADDSVDVVQSEISASTMGTGRGGDIEISGDRLSIQNQSQISASTTSDGDGGTIGLRGDESVDLFQAEISASTMGTGRGGDIVIQGDRLTAQNQSQITASTSGAGDGGTIGLQIDGAVNLRNSQISASTAGQGAGGDIDLATTRLRVNGQSQITASTSGAGAGGEIQIDAAVVTLDGDGAEISASTSGAGDGGGIDLTSRQLTLRAGGQITASTSGAGRGGDIEIEAADAILLQGTTADGQFASGIFSTTDAGAGDRGGTLTLSTSQLTLQDNAVVSAVTRSDSRGGNIDLTVDRLDITAGGQVLTTAFAAGDAGLIDIQAADQVRLQGFSPGRTADNTGGDRQTGTASGIFANTQGEGNAGQRLRIQADRALIVEDGAQISASTSGQGDGGRITLTTDRLTLRTGGQIAASTTRRQSGGDAGEIEIGANRVTITRDGEISTSTAGDGDAGRVSLQANQLTVSDGGQISSITAGSGNAGDLDVRVRDRIEVDGPDSGLFASTTRNSTGDGGSIFIDPDLVTLNNGARIAVTSEGAGIGGNITIRAGRLFLDNGSAISAATGSNQGGNVTILLDDVLVLRRGSLLSASAGTNTVGDRQGDGGNITIRANLVAAVPAENSDISANAVAGNGGRVSIFAPLGIYGIEFREFETLLSDITVSSEFGVSGTVSLETPDVDPSQGLTELPSEPVEPEITSACRPQGGETTSEFVDTGRGGLPLSPSDSSAEASATWEDLRPLPGDSLQVGVGRSLQEEEPPPLVDPLTGQVVVEVQGWRIGENGEIILTADSPTVIPYSSLRSPSACPPDLSIQGER